MKCSNGAAFVQDLSEVAVTKTPKVEQLGTQSQGRQGVRKFLKKVMTKLMRREARKQIKDADTDLNPKRSYLGWY